MFMDRIARVPWLVVLLTSFLVLYVKNLDRPSYPLAVFDQSFYLSIAYDVARHGVFGDGVFDQVDGTRQAPPPGMFIAPVYPALLSLVMRFDPAFFAAAGCMLEARAQGRAGDSGCPNHTSIMRPLHLAFWAGTVACLHVLAGAMFAWRPAVWATTLAALGAAVINLKVTNYLMTESLTVFLATGHATALYFALRRRRPGLMLLAGLALGLLTLTRPSYLYLFWLYAALAMAIVAIDRSAVRRWGWPGLAFALGFACLVLPWVLRNGATCGHLALTWGYGASVLVERLAYNEMTVTEWAVSFLYWLPDMGDQIVAALFPHALYDRLNWDLPGSFYMDGNARRGVLAAATPELDRLLPGLMRDELLPNLPWHVMVTLSLFWRGLWVYKYVSLILMPVLAWFMVRSLVRRDWIALVVVLPPVVMNGLHGFLAVNQPRYNLSLIIGLALAAGWAVAALRGRSWRRPFSRTVAG